MRSSPPQRPTRGRRGCGLSRRHWFHWRALAATVDRNIHPGDVVVFFRGDAYDAYAPAAYLHTSYYRREKYGPIVLAHDPPDASLLEQLRRAPGVLVITVSPERLSESLGHPQLKWLGYEAGAGGLWRATWSGAQSSQ